MYCRCSMYLLPCYVDYHSWGKKYWAASAHIEVNIKQSQRYRSIIIICQMGCTSTIPFNFACCRVLRMCVKTVEHLESPLWTPVCLFKRVCVNFLKSSPKKIGCVCMRACTKGRDCIPFRSLSQLFQSRDERAWNPNFRLYQQLSYGYQQARAREN